MVREIRSKRILPSLMNLLILRDNESAYEYVAPRPYQLPFGSGLRAVHEHEGKFKLHEDKDTGNPSKIPCRSMSISDSSTVWTEETALGYCHY